jgi:hypothetical protein
MTTTTARYTDKYFQDFNMDGFRLHEKIDDNNKLFYDVKGGERPARYHRVSSGSRWEYYFNMTWNHVGVKRNLFIRTYTAQVVQNIVQNTIVVEGGDEDSNKCNICLENTQFPMSNGCCSYKFCKSCFDQMPANIKNTCGGCRQNTVFSTIPSTQPILQNPIVQAQRQELIRYQESYRVANENHGIMTELYNVANENHGIMTELYTAQCKDSEIDSIKLLKHNELYKFNAHMSYMAIGLVILQHFL